MAANDIIWTIVLLISVILAFQFGRAWEILWRELRRAKWAIFAASARHLLELSKYRLEDSMITKDAVGAYVAKNRKKFRLRYLSVGASEIGQCARKIQYSKDRIRPDADFVDGWGATSRGSMFENALWAPAMKEKYGRNLLYSGKQQKRLKLGNLSATPDGLLINQPKDALAGLFVPNIGPSGEIVIDCKTIDPRISLNEPKPEHMFQVQVQIGMFRELTKHKPDYGVISYTNASFFDDCVEFVVKFDPKIFAQAKLRADEIMAATAPDQLKPEGWIAGGDECKYCPFKAACTRLRGRVPDDSKAPRPDPQFLEQMRALAIEERSWDTKASDAEVEQRKIQHEIKEMFRLKGLRRIDEGDLKIIWSAVKGRPSYDWPGIRAACAAVGVDIEKYSTSGDPSDRLVITVLGRDRLKTMNK